MLYPSAESAINPRPKEIDLININKTIKPLTGQAGIEFLDVGSWDIMLNRTTCYGQLITVHSFRGCFKTWTTEKTDTDWLTGEMALAHKIKDKSYATYQKGQLIDKRRRLMQKYSDYACATPQSKVVSIAGSFNNHKLLI